MTCEDFTTLIHLNRPGERTEEEERALERHLRTCGSCRDEAELVRDTSAGMDFLRRTQVPVVRTAYATGRIMDTIRRGTGPKESIFDSILRAASWRAVRYAYAIGASIVLLMMARQLAAPDIQSGGETIDTGPYVAYDVGTEPLRRLPGLPFPSAVKASIMTQRTVEIQKADIDRYERFIGQAMLRPLNLTREQRRQAATIIASLEQTSRLTYRFGRIGG